MRKNDTRPRVSLDNKTNAKRRATPRRRCAGDLSIADVRAAYGEEVARTARSMGAVRRRLYLRTLPAVGEVAEG